MEISAHIRSGIDDHVATVRTNGRQTRVAIPAREGGAGSSLNGGELLCLSLATCYGNDVFREARHWGIDVLDVEVTVEAEFGESGEPARRLGYHVRVEARADEAEIADLIRHTDRVAEIHATLRLGIDVSLDGFDAVDIRP